MYAYSVFCEVDSTQVVWVYVESQQYRKSIGIASQHGPSVDYQGATSMRCELDARRQYTEFSAVIKKKKAVGMGVSASSMLSPIYFLVFLKLEQTV